MAWVIDASSVVDLLSGGAPGERTWEVVGPGPLHAPDLVVGEVISALARMARAGHPGTDEAVHEFTAMPLTVHASMSLAAGAWSRRDNLRVTDGFYVELASTLDLPLITSDARLGRVVRQQGFCDVRVIEI